MPFHASARPGHSDGATNSSGIVRHVGFALSAICGMNSKAAIRYLALCEDAIDWPRHDRRYHGGRFDPKRMECDLRDQRSRGDNADDLSAAESREDRKFALREKDPRILTDDEFVEAYTSPLRERAKQTAKALRKMYPTKGAADAMAAAANASKSGGEGFTFDPSIGEIDGKKVYPSANMAEEFVNASNGFYLRGEYRDGVSKDWQTKLRIAKHIPELIEENKRRILESHRDHDSKSHMGRETGGGSFLHMPFEYGGTKWYFVITQGEDGNLYLYDVVRDNGYIDRKRYLQQVAAA